MDWRTSIQWVGIGLEQFVMCMCITHTASGSLFTTWGTRWARWPPEPWGTRGASGGCACSRSSWFWTRWTSGTRGDSGASGGCTCSRGSGYWTRWTSGSRHSGYDWSWTVFVVGNFHRPRTATVRACMHTHTHYSHEKSLVSTEWITPECDVCLCGWNEGKTEAIVETINF